MIRWQTLMGIAVGLACGIAFLRLAEGNRPASAAGPILSECTGHFRELVIHYEPSAKDIVTTTYRDFLGALENDVTVRVVCPDAAAFAELHRIVGPVRCRLRPVVVRHPMTPWSRDRWVALTPADPGAPTTLLTPRGEAADDLWPARAGDARIGADLAAALAPAVRARRSRLYFDGGDFLADGENVVVAPRMLPRNVQRTVSTKAELLAILGAEFKRRVVLLDQAPDHHVAMFMVSAGNRTMLVGDPSLGRQLWPATADPPGESPDLPGGPDFTPPTQRLFDAVAAQCSAEGYRVVRVPTIPACDGRTYLTYANVLLDRQGDRRIVYLPFYRGAESLNAAACRIWEGLGYEVRSVDCTATYRHFGCLHCLVNVLTRS